MDFEGFEEIVEVVGTAFDAAGLGAITVGAIVCSVVAAASLLRREDDVYAAYRRRLGRSILLGLELLVAADIIRTVAVIPSFADVAVLGLVVLIRTFLSFSLELEITGRWPWQQEDPAQAKP